MTKILETYDPKGEELWDDHLEAQRAVMNKIDALLDRGETVPPELFDERDEHHRAWQRAELSRFRTIHDYAAHRFAYLASQAERKGVPFTMPTFDDGDIIDDGIIEYRRISQMIDAADNDSSKYLPAGRPNGFDIFEPGADRYVCSMLRAFEGGWFYPRRVVALVSVDSRPTETHICLGDFPDHPDGVGLACNDEHILEVLYQEALEAERNEQKLWAEWFAERLGRWSNEGFDAFCYPRTGLTPANMHVYAYTPPERGREAFLQLDLDLYRHPPKIKDAKPLDCAPAYIRNLRYAKAFRRVEPPVTIIA